MFEESNDDVRFDLDLFNRSRSQLHILACVHLIVLVDEVHVYCIEHE